MNKSKAQSRAERKRKLVNRKRRIQYRLRDINWAPQDEPMFRAGNIRYELADRVRGLGPGGIGAMHLLARRTGLAEAIDRRLHVLKVHLPYHESEHVLNMAYNLLAGGTCLEDLELWRNDEVYLDALGAQRIPDPTTAGDFCRRFTAVDVEILMNTINNVRVKVWRQLGFRQFVNGFVRVPCQVVRTSRRLAYRLLAWNPWQHVFLRGVDALHTMSTWRHPLRC